MKRMLRLNLRHKDALVWLRPYYAGTRERQLFYHRSQGYGKVGSDRWIQDDVGDIDASCRSGALSPSAGDFGPELMQ